MKNLHTRLKSGLHPIHIWVYGSAHQIQIMWEQSVRNKTFFFCFFIFFFIFIFIHGIIHVFTTVIIQKLCFWPLCTFRKTSAIIIRRFERHWSVLYYVQKQLPRSVSNTSRELLLSALKLPPLNTRGKYKLLLLLSCIFSLCGLPWALLVKVCEFKRFSQLSSTRNEIEPNLFDLLANCAES